MARLTTPGIWLPGPLNTINSSSPTAQADIAGNPFYMGLNPGKLVVLSTQEAQNVAAAGTLVSGSTLYDGSYQYVQLDSGATAAYALAGSPAFMLLDQGRQKGRCRRRLIRLPVVTTADVANYSWLEIPVLRRIHQSFDGEWGIDGSHSRKLDDDLCRRRARGSQCWFGGERRCRQLRLPRHKQCSGSSRDRQRPALRLGNRASV